jgi:hypothetical protein
MENQLQFEEEYVGCNNTPIDESNLHIEIAEKDYKTDMGFSEEELELIKKKLECATAGEIFQQITNVINKQTTIIVDE